MVGQALDSVKSIQVYRRHITELLAKAAQIKGTTDIEPELTEDDLGDDIRRLNMAVMEECPGIDERQRFDSVDLVFRQLFYDLVARISVYDSEAVQIWNLLDVVSIFGDLGQCVAPLFFWLVEELLDSQTVDGCRRVLDFLESRRERNIKNSFKEKSLPLLRTCNELLRRLSRAEDTVFCGRVYIFLFQSFPLHDKSSVNLRAEFHVENTTTFDGPGEEDQKEGEHAEKMDLDEPQPPSQEEVKKETPANEGEPGKSQQGPSAPATTRTTEKKPEASLNDYLTYAMFWSLQGFFSAPTKLFERENFSSFQKGLETTMTVFQQVKAKPDTKNSFPKPQLPSSNDVGTPVNGDSSPRGTKRKHSEQQYDILYKTFNPKYLTSRHLFELEVNDVTFRRHILVQALIILDFLLSLTPSAKAKVKNATNRSLQFTFNLAEEDEKWAVQMRNSVASYLQEGPEGKFYYRMVDTVLTRDHNWVRWKSQSCPGISQPPVSAAEFLETENASARIFANKRLRAAPMGALDVSFLDDSKAGGLESLKQPERFAVPKSDSYMRGIADDDFNIDMTDDPEEKEEAKKAKISKSWRTLRLASRERFLQFAKIQDCKNLDALFATESDVGLHATSSATPAVTVEEKEKVEQKEMKELERRKSVAGDAPAHDEGQKGHTLEQSGGSSDSKPETGTADEDTNMENLQEKTSPGASNQTSQPTAGNPVAAGENKTESNPSAPPNTEAPAASNTENKT